MRGRQHGKDLRCSTEQGFQKRSDKSGINFKGIILAASWRIDRVQHKDGVGARRERQDTRVLWCYR